MKILDESLLNRSANITRNNFYPTKYERILMNFFRFYANCFRIPSVLSLFS